MSSILVIDDDVNLRSSMVNLLRAHDWDVVEASTYAEAEHLVRGTEPDVILSDWDLGFYEVLNGGEIVTRLRSIHPAGRYVIWSGLDRVVPDGVEFFLKGNLTKLLEGLGD